MYLSERKPLVKIPKYILSCVKVTVNKEGVGVRYGAASWPNCGRYGHGPKTLFLSGRRLYQDPPSPPLISELLCCTFLSVKYFPGERALSLVKK